MTPSEEANLPRWRGQMPFYEIWFVVVFERDRAHAHWLRYTVFSTKDDARATLWAATFDVEREPIFEKRILPISAFDRGPLERFRVGIGDAELSHGTCRGATSRIAWDLTFEPGERPSLRTPRVAEKLPLPARVSHVHDGVPLRGTITVDGVRREVDGAATQMHIWGKKRVRALQWVHAVGEEHDRLEVVAVRPATSVFFADGDRTIDLTQPPAALRARARIRAPGVLDVRAGSVRVRAACDPRTLAGYVYRDTDGRDLYVAQSDVATCHVETKDRERVWRGAVEFHGPKPLEGVRYIGWDDTTAPPIAPAIAEVPSSLPTPRAIAALGLTYRDHVRETSSRGETAAFTKDPASFLPNGAWVDLPSSDEMIDALDRVEPGLGKELRARFGYLPAMLDYEVELAMVMLESGQIGWLVANDVTARSCQVLGSGARDPMTFWSVAKSFPGFMPVTPRAFVHPTVPDVTLTLRVNGEVRQRAHTSELVLSLDQIVRRAQETLGRDLAAGDYVLTGTPAGVAMRVSRLKRALGERFLDRFGRLRAAISMYRKSDAFLRRGDIVEIDGGFLGRRTVTVR